MLDRLKAGSSWQNVSKVFGLTTELTYTLEEMSERTIVFVGTNDRSIAYDTINVDAAGGGSVVTYRAEPPTMRGAAKLLTPVMNVVFEKLASQHPEAIEQGAQWAGW